MSYSKTGASQKTLLPPSLKQRLKSFGSKLTGLCLVTLSLCAWAALATWHTSDPNTNLSSDMPVQNLLGAHGAEFASMALQFFGFAAIFLILPLCALGVHFWRETFPRFMKLRLLLWPLSIILVAGAFATIQKTSLGNFPYNPGGFVGDSVLGLTKNLVAPLNAAHSDFFTLMGFILLGGITLFFATSISLRDLISLCRKAPNDNAGHAPAPNRSWYARWKHRRAIKKLRANAPRKWWRGADNGDNVAVNANSAPHTKANALSSFDTPKTPAGEAIPTPMPAHVAETPVPSKTTPLMRPKGPTIPVQAASASAQGAATARSIEDPLHDTLMKFEDDGIPFDQIVKPPVTAQPEPNRPRAIKPHDELADPVANPVADMVARAQNEMTKPQTVKNPPETVEAEGNKLADTKEASPAATSTPASNQKPDEVQKEENDPMAHMSAAQEHPVGAATSSTDTGVETPNQKKKTGPNIVKNGTSSSTMGAQGAPTNPKQKTFAFLDAADSQKNGSHGFVLPPVDLLTKPPETHRFTSVSEEHLREEATKLENVLLDFGVKGQIINVRPGPVVTLFELEPARGTKSSRVIGLADDIARSMSAYSARIAVIPGRNALGIELPNDERETVYLRELIGAEHENKSKEALPLVLGKTIDGSPLSADLTRMPHLLIAGTTGSGKSVGINTMITSLLYQMSPDECKLIMIDPKMLELSVYDGIPHLLTPVVTDPKKALSALKWTVREMEDRYQKMSKAGVRNIAGFNEKVREARKTGEELIRTVQTGFDRDTGEAIYEHETLDFEPMPYIVVVIDEMADLMMVAGKEIEAAVQRLAQMARASGIHLITATQRPSVDVITGTIKANFPTRISFQVTSKVDSRTILGEQGAEQLLGAGDMLYMPGGTRMTRVHGAFISDEEVEKITDHLRAQGVPQYLDDVIQDDDDTGEEATNAKSGGKGEDEKYDEAVMVVLRDQKASISYVQRRLSIGYNRAATLIERMEENGVIGPADRAGKRDILIQAAPEPFDY